MSENTTAARPYARAVYQQALETSSIDSWSKALALMASVVEDATMAEYLDNPETGREQKGEMLLKVIGDKLNTQQANLIKLMAENARLTALPVVAAQFEAFRAESEGKVEAEVTSAFDLTDDQLNAITATLTKTLGREVSLTATTDASLIGGVVIKAGDTIIDASMKSQLESLAISLGR